MLDFDERDLVDLAERAGFGEVYLRLAGVIRWGSSVRFSHRSTPSGSGAHLAGSDHAREDGWSPNVHAQACARTSASPCALTESQSLHRVKHRRRDRRRGNPGTGAPTVSQLTKRPRTASREHTQRGGRRFSGTAADGVSQPRASFVSVAVAARSSGFSSSELDARPATAQLVLQPPRGGRRGASDLKCSRC
jgi:hypothetical protein